jgi:type II secretory pathway pseudopilin PulG
LIELIGVLAIIAILAVAVMGSIIRRVDRAYVNREIAELDTIGEAFVQSCLRNKRIPSTNGNDWATNVAKEIAMPASRITTTARATQRVFLMDPPSLASSGYTQTGAGTVTFQTNARALVASTLTAGSILSGSFNSLWNSTDNDDVHIKRLDLGSLFHKVRLLNIDSANGWYSFDANAASFVPGNSSNVTVYVLDGTAVNLYMTNSSWLQLRVILGEDDGFIYQRGRWSRDLSAPQLDPSIGPYGDLVSAFLNAGLPPDPANGATPQGTIESFYNYMVNYIIWSNGDPDPAHGITNWQGGGLSSGPSYPYFKVLNASQVQLNQVSNDLIK